MKTHLSRREFVVGSLAVGFALAVMPVSADTITTDSKGLVAGEVKIPVEGGAIPAYRAMPASGGPFPTILVVHESLASTNISRTSVADSPSKATSRWHLCFFRVKATSRVWLIREQIIAKVVAKVPDQQVASDLDATLAWAKSTGKADITKLGIVGFCWGGRQVWLYAAHNPSVKAGAAWYGPLQSPPSDVRPKNPIDLANQINVPVLGLYGGKDMGIPMAQIEQMRAALKAAGKPSEIVVYPDAGHGFNADYRPSYNPQAAEDGWKRMLAWFREHDVA